MPAIWLVYRKLKSEGLHPDPIFYQLLRISPVIPFRLRIDLNTKARLLHISLPRRRTSCRMATSLLIVSRPFTVSTGAFRGRQGDDSPHRIGSVASLNCVREFTWPTTRMAVSCRSRRPPWHPVHTFGRAEKSLRRQQSHRAVSCSKTGRHSRLLLGASSVRPLSVSEYVGTGPGAGNVSREAFALFIYLPSDW